jgi:FkbM family methyltransferase
MITNHLVTYAQNREDIVLQAFFGAEEIGFYVDVGAYDPDEDSVTKYFYLRGWRGINVEPQPDRYKFFLGKRSEDINVNYGISNKHGKLVLRSYANQGLSTFSSTIQDEYKKNGDNQTADYKDIDVKVITLKELFTDQKVKTIQFLKVDVEGLEYEVLDGNDWEHYRPEVICIEANHVKKDWRSLLKDKKYTLVFFDGINEYYTDNGTDRAAKFDYVEAIVFKEPIVNQKLLQDFERYDEHIAWLESTIESLREENEIAHAQEYLLQNTLNEVIPLRRHLKRQVRHNAVRADRRIVNKLSRKSKFQPIAGDVEPSANDGADMIDAAKEYDKKNFDSFSKATQSHAALPLYLASRNAAYKTLRKAKHKIKGSTT